MPVRFVLGDTRRRLAEMASDTFDCAVTSPPYFGLRDYGMPAQIGLEPTLQEYLDELVTVFREVRRVLKPAGTFWLNIGDSYAGSWGAQSRRDTASDDASWHGSQIKNHPKRASNTGSIKMAGLKPKDLMMVPARLALALQADGWWIRSEIIWHKPNPMPESVRDRPTSAHEKIWLLTKSDRYFFDTNAVREDYAESTKRIHGNGLATKKQGVEEYQLGCGRSETSNGGLMNGAGRLAAGGRNVRNVWTIAPKPFKEAHFATFPPELAERCIKAGCPAGGHVLDPFGGAGTTGLVADRLGRDATLIELNPNYMAIAERRILPEFMQCA